MYPYDLTICLPSLRIENLNDFYNSIEPSAQNYTVQLIIIGPKTPNINLTKHNNVKFISDYGTPARCVQIAASIAEGKFITWASDDGLYTENSLKNAIDMLSKKPIKDGVTIRYTESVERKGPPPNDVILTDAYWRAWTHKDLRLPGIPKDYAVAPLGMYYTDMFKYLGGLDCRFVHVNLNAHDLAFRVQKNGGTIHLTRDFVLHCDFENNADRQHLINAYYTNDAPLLRQLYASPTALDDMSLTIDFNNWRNSPTHWREFI